MNLQKDLRSLLNYYSAENGSDTPDFILAQYLVRCLEAFEEAVNARAQWGSPPASKYAEAVKRAEAHWLGSALRGVGYVPAEHVDPHELQQPWPDNVGACSPGEPGYRWAEHHRPQPPCYECIDVENDEDPRPWCDCQDGETCAGPCRHHAHDPSFHLFAQHPKELGLDDTPSSP